MFRNQRDGTFLNITTDVISDHSGMGSAVADSDNDGDLDWFVSSITHLEERDETGDPKLLDGNRLYRNGGSGIFEDVTGPAGVRVGGWGWGSSFVDVNNDCWVDLVHTNGWFSENRGYPTDPTRLFVSRGDGTFDETAVEAGIDDQGQGRGVVCFDFDGDGDLDIFQANLNEPSRLFRNDTPADLGWLHVVLQGPGPNTEAVGARIHVSIGGLTQMRELRCGNNYVSANAVEAHFGLGVAPTVDQVRVTWPDRTETVLHDVAADQRLVIAHPSRAP